MCAKEGVDCRGQLAELSHVMLNEERQAVHALQLTG